MIALVLAAAISSAGTGERGHTYLVSLADLQLQPRERLESFSIETWGVSVEAVCRIPRGWRIRAGGSAAPDGVLEGESTQGTTQLPDLSALAQFALIKVHGPVQDREIDGVPPTFAGKARIAGAVREREITLTARHIRLTSARACARPR